MRTSTYTTWDNKTGYVGFEYTSRGRTCYGWMHVKVEAGGVGYTVLDFAYNTKPNEPILAGVQTTNPATLQTPTNLSNAGVYASGFYASWATFPEAASYEIQLNSSSGWVTAGNSTTYYLWIPKQGTQTVYEFRVRAKNGEAFSEWSTSHTINLQSGSLGLSGSDNAKSFTIYPNPATDAVNFNFENIDASRVKISIYNSVGMLVETLHNTTVYSLKYLNKGVYIIVATDGNFTEKKKLLVE